VRCSVPHHTLPRCALATGYVAAEPGCLRFSLSLEVPLPHTPLARTPRVPVHPRMPPLPPPADLQARPELGATFWCSDATPRRGTGALLHFGYDNGAAPPRATGAQHPYRRVRVCACTNNDYTLHTTCSSTRQKPRTTSQVAGAVAGTLRARAFPL
jgi:hypothetical protein